MADYQLIVPKGKLSKSLNVNTYDHFRDVTKMIALYSESKQKANDLKMRQLENLPPAEEIKKVERRVASNEKKIEKTSSKLPKKVE